MSTDIQAYIAEQFGVTTELHPEPLFTIAGSLLSTEIGMQEVLRAYTPLMKALEPAAAGTYFIGRLGALNGAMQYMVSHDTLLDLSPELWTLQIFQHDKGYIEFRFVLSEIRLLAGPSEGQRSAWREERLTQWYDTHIRPIIEATSVAAVIDITHLWKLFPTRLRYQIDHWKEETASEALIQRYEEDWTFVSKELSGQAFRRNRNPFDVKFIMIDYPGTPGEPDKQIRMKSACCMYYRTEGGNYCYTCPRMKPGERDERKELLREKFAKEAAVKAAAN
ncbi:hypothetical protein GCM10008018_05210 [Paenibacillus marchantiophytorum]|uniref:Ferric siderophore reductase C-terminal domain-containing protein n=1 Tax=Paenibacillus marchantiophytorum TaxID=1619310 RepID=A0ABQ2BNZ9_9BACL|nr:(2Fe-2S)-binding protein [Paenibacillus marchantiophytorum]GGI44059.1 hypothetical protein GCM10008018_05210 [Paenibacillus marchantiophytorum]